MVQLLSDDQRKWGVLDDRIRSKQIDLSTKELGRFRGKILQQYRRSIDHECWHWDTCRGWGLCNVAATGRRCVSPNAFTLGTVTGTTS